ncbi:MAG: 33 kDa chaperonin [Methyloligella sp.]|nr:MAG: 33 kDa chaperonin [Methyloligella sp.]
MSDEEHGSDDDIGTSHSAVSDDGYIFLDSDIKDDVVLPFQADEAGARGRLVRLGSTVDKILSDHDYPDGVATYLGEAIALTCLIGASLKFDGKLILQSKTDGPISMLVVDYTTPGKLRGYASYNKAAVAELEADGVEHEIGSWLGRGYLALTVDQGADMERYQGIVAVERDFLGTVAEDYFMQSEQIPSLVRLNVAKHYNADAGDDGKHWHWRAGGLLVQYLTREGGHDYDSDEPFENFEEDWNRARMLGETVEAHELLDPELAPERLLLRLYHEEGVRIFDKVPVKAECSCSREKVQNMLSHFSSDERGKMIEMTGKISVTCEFCTSTYEFSETDFEAKS